MAVEFPKYDSGNPRPHLAAFILAVRDFLAELVGQRRYPDNKMIFYENLLGEMSAAWSEASPMFEQVANETSRITDGSIRDHGLDGAQLRFKFSVVRFLHSRFLNLPGVGRLRGLIGAIDTLLSSILGALGAGEGIKEIKEYIEHSLAD